MHSHFAYFAVPPSPHFVERERERAQFAQASRPAFIELPFHLLRRGIIQVMNAQKGATKVLKTDADGRDSAPLEEAAQMLRDGGLVAFPTETVYGLGANALSPEAVARIFEAKGRPSNNPLIVHIPSIEQAKRLVREWTPLAQKLAEAFWPGPLTLVLPKSDLVPEIVTGGGSTVALRVPAHPVALQLLIKTGVPIAAPSANRSLSLSPTCAEHVMKSLGGRIELILDGGSCGGGIESTVLNLTVDPPQILRLGLISALEIEAVIGAIDLLQSADSQIASSSTFASLSPGMAAKHYAPDTPLILGDEKMALELGMRGEKVAFMTRQAPLSLSELHAGRYILIPMPQTPAGYAASLYATLHRLDEAGYTRLVAEPLPPSEDWNAVRDRLARASFNN